MEPMTMALLLGGSIAGSTGLSIMGAQQQKAHQKRMGEYNARMAEMQAADVERQGAKAHDQLRKNIASTKGAQIASMAAQGIDVNDGSALELTQETDILGAEDAMNLRMDAYKKAWGLRQEAQNYRNNYEMQAKAINNQITGALFNAVYQGASLYAGYQGKGATGTTTAKT